MKEILKDITQEGNLSWMESLRSEIEQRANKVVNM